MTATKQRLNKAQRAALKAYNFAVAQEERYMASVFVNAHGERKVVKRTGDAYEACKALGMTHEHGL